MKGLFTSARHHRRAHDFLQAIAQLLSYTILNMTICQSVYICAALFLKNSKTIPIEWIKPFDFAEKLLSEFEANLIYWSKPELNTQHMKKEPTFEYGQVHAQNVTGATYFWHDKFI